jgi:DNA-binding beta-propeller fold protein YncE
MTMKKETHKRFVIFVKMCISGIVLFLSFCGCSGPRSELFFPSDKLLVWPEPPEQPRIRYVGSISTQADVQKQASWTQDLSELIFGRKKIGVLVAPYAVAVDLDDRLYVTDTSVGVVHIFDLKKRQYVQFTEMDNHEKLLKPVGLAIVDRWIYVVDSMLHKVCVFDKKGKYLFSFGGERLTRPSGIAYRQDEKALYITDTARHVINIFTSGGKFIRQVGSRGTSPGMFNFPTHLWTDKNGNLYVSDTLNYRIQMFANEHGSLRMFGQQGDRPGNFAHPCGIATDSYGNIYVTDRQFENVQIFNTQGQILMAFGREGTQAGQFWLPSGICIDRRNRIYVADSFNKRIQIFELVEQAEK